jgi:hypothetical protein
MVPIIQFDPASMALVYDTQMIGSADPQGSTSEAVAAVVWGRAADAFDVIDRIEDAATRDRALQIVSAMWHEKRHFLDFVISNYGAYRFRQFLDLYVNMPTVLGIAEERGVIHAPLEVYLDDVRSAVLGIRDRPEDLVILAKELARRRKMLERDRVRQATRFGTVEIGGEAQLECLAFMAQLDFISVYFGIEGVQRFYASLFDREQFQAKYMSMVMLAQQLGVLPTAVEPHGLHADPVLLECILFASLQTDHLPTRSAAAQFESSYPADRFAGICVELVQNHRALCSAKVDTLSFEECWTAVNETCATLYGRTAIDQIEDDIEHFTKEAKAKYAGNVPDDVENVLDDYLGLRSAMLAELRRDPALFVSARRFTLDLADRLQPNYVISASGGVVGDPPDGYDKLMGYVHDEGDIERRPYRKWWWACVPNSELRQQMDAERVFRFANPKSWYSVMDFYAPTAKLLMNGRRIRTLIGPELLFAEQRLQGNMNIKTELFPTFAFPDEHASAELFYYFFGRDVLKCDLSSVELHRPEGRALSPWTLRRWPKLAKYVIEKMGGHEVAYFSFVKDWSPWIVSDAVFEQLRPLMHA